MTKKMSDHQKRYLEEYQKYAHIKIDVGDYTHSEGIAVEVIEVNEDEEWAIVRTKSSGVERKRTLHWCRKRLTRVNKENNQ